MSNKLIQIGKKYMINHIESINIPYNNIDCRLISFNISGYLEFIEKEGFGYYWWRNRLSFNYGNKLEYRGLPNVLRGYAFDDKNYKFLNVE